MSMSMSMDVRIPKATILKSGKYHIQMRLSGKSYSITGSSEEECRQKALLLKVNYANGIDPTEVENKSLTLHAAACKYIKERRNTLSPSTINGYVTILNTRFQSVMNKQIGKVKSWQSIVNQEASICSAKTLKNAWGFIAAVLKENDVEYGKISLPQVVKNEIPWLNFKQIKIFLKAIEGSKYEIACLLALHGLRRSEILAITPSSFDFDKNVIKVQGSVVKSTNGYVRKETNKNTSSNRIVPIMIPRLLSLAKDTDNLIPFRPDSLRDYIKRICADNYLPLVGVHGLRHSFCSLCFHLNIPPEQCMLWGGWSDLSTMNNIYRHLSSYDSNKYTKIMQDFFSEE